LKVSANAIGTILSRNLFRIFSKFLINTIVLFSAFCNIYFDFFLNSRFLSPIKNAQDHARFDNDPAHPIFP